MSGYNVLALDGGGCRGIITAVLIEQLANEQLTSILEGRAEPNPNPKPGAVARLRHWLADAARSESD